MLSRTREVAGVDVPQFFYGTAWKEEETKRLTQLALQQGFRAIDTANQRRHYVEADVGQAIREAIDAGTVTREELFLQTKFTFIQGQDHRLPYEPDAPVAEQVAQSFASSQKHLHSEIIESYVLHGPSQRRGLSDDDWSAWQAMEQLHDSGNVRFLGVSNVTDEQLRLLCDNARVRPAFVQNRCYAIQAWDLTVREICTALNIVYQGFSLLTANRQVLADPLIVRIAQRHNRTVNQIVFRFALAVGMIPLTGTTDAEHMREDLGVFDFDLEPEEVERIETIALR